MTTLYYVLYFKKIVSFAPEGSGQAVHFSERLCCNRHTKLGFSPSNRSRIQGLKSRQVVGIALKPLVKTKQPAPQYAGAKDTDSLLSLCDVEQFFDLKLRNDGVLFIAIKIYVISAEVI